MNPWVFGDLNEKEILIPVPDLSSIEFLEQSIPEPIEVGAW